MPSWLKKSIIPRDFGDTLAGTIKAHKWHLLCTIHVPVALISMWGLDTVHLSPSIADCCQKMLNHTMLLIAAVRLALLTITDKAIMERYLENIKDYIHDLQQIHSKAPLVPNYHMAFHIYNFLSLFGPAYSWWTFLYEQLIGQLQCTSTSNRFGMPKIHNIFAFIY